MWHGAALEGSILLQFDGLDPSCKNDMANMHDWLPPRQLRTMKDANLQDSHAYCEQMCKLSSETWKRSTAAT